MRTNRALDLLGVPDLPVRAFIKEGGQIKPQGGSSGGGGPTSQTVTQTNIPEWARPYAEEMLGDAQALTDTGRNPFEPYQGQRFAGFSPMQAQAFQNVAGQQVAPQLADASNLAYTGAQQGLGAQQTAQGLQQTALGYGGAGAGFGGAASQFGIAGAQQAQRASQLAQAQALGYGAQGAQFGASGADMAAQAQRAAEGQADLYGQMGAGFGTSAAGLAPEAQMYGAQGAQFGQAGMGFGAQGAGIGGIGVQQAQQGFGAGAQYAGQATSPDAMQAYMSPYMQNVVEAQQREARRASEIQQQAIQSQAAQQGAFGGSRSAILEAERQRNLGTQLGDIQAAGSQRAFEQAQQAQQFGAGLGLQGLQAGFQGLQTGMAGTAQGMQGAGVGISGAQAGLQGLGQASDLYGRGMQGAGLGLQGTGQRLAAGQLGLAGTAQGMQGSEVGLRGVGQQIAGGQLGLEGARTGIAGQQAGISGAQAGMQGVGQAVGAGQYGLSGAQLGISGAGALGQLGQEQYAQEMGITDAMQKYGALQQGQSQQQRDFEYQQFLAQQQYPYQQLSYMSDLLRGVPSTQSAQLTYAQQPNQAAQLLGAGLGAYGAFGRKEGGQIKKYQEGGQIKKYGPGGDVSPTAMSTMAVHELPSRLKRLSDSQLAAYARSVTDAITLSAVQSEMMRRSRSRAPMGEMPQETVADEVIKRAGEASIGRPAVGMYGGGIVALSPGGVIDRINRFLFPKSSGEAMTDADLDKKMGIVTPSAEISGSPVKIAPANAPTMPPGVTPTLDERGFPMAKDGGQRPNLFDQIPTGAPPPAQGDPELDDRASPVGIGLLSEDRRQEQAPPPATQGAMPSLANMTFDQWRQMSSQVVQDPADLEVLADMKARVDSRMARAEGQENTAKFDAILMAGLAMMGGTSLADGIARAAQTGGATFLAGKKDAAKAVDAAEDAELAFNKYRMELRKGDEKAAQSAFENYMGYTAKMAQIGATREVGLARAGAEKDSTLWARYSQAVRGDPRIANAQKAVDNARTPEAQTTAQQAYTDTLRTVEQEYMRRFGLSDLGASTPTGNAEDQAALKWANANPNDPRSAQIKQRLGQ